MGEDLRTIKLAPSEFAFLYEDCKRCFWLKASAGVKLPREPFPGIFSKIDSAAKKAIATRADLERLGVKGYTPSPFPGRFKSLPVRFHELGVELVINCQMDQLWRHDEGWYEVNDLKTTEPKDAKVALYGRQLHAYGYCMMHSDDPGKVKTALRIDPGEDIVVKGTSLLCWNPSGMGRRQEELPNVHNLIGAWSYHKVPYDMDAFMGFLHDVAVVCAGPEPEPGAKCARCEFVKEIGAYRSGSGNHKIPEGKLEYELPAIVASNGEVSHQMPDQRALPLEWREILKEKGVAFLEPGGDREAYAREMLGSYDVTTPARAPITGGPRVRSMRG